MMCGKGTPHLLCHADSMYGYRVAGNCIDGRCDVLQVLRVKLQFHFHNTVPPILPSCQLSVFLFIRPSIHLLMHTHSLAYPSQLPTHVLTHLPFHAHTHSFAHPSNFPLATHSSSYISILPSFLHSILLTEPSVFPHTLCPYIYSSIIPTRMCFC